MEIVRDPQALKEAIRRQRRDGKTLGLVPTMGALHAGHLALVDRARAEADAVVVSIFVNPIQFGPGEDFARYPRSEEEDLKLLERAGVAIAYLPAIEQIYPSGFSTEVRVGAIAEELCGAFRPGHFDGVATVVLKLFHQTSADVAVFGEKDYQQLHVLRRMARDLDLAIRIVGAPILREADGLALSSRNRYLSVSERKIAPALYRILTQTAQALREGKGSKTLLPQARRELKEGGFSHVDYVELRDAETLASVCAAKNPARLLAAVHLGKTRLIDNVAV